MKFTCIALQDIRAFDEPCPLNFTDGKNRLLLSVEMRDRPVGISSLRVMLAEIQIVAESAK